MVDGAGSPWRAAVSRVLAALREPPDPPPRPPRRALRVLVWVASAVLAIVGAATSGGVVDLARTGAGVAPFVGAASGLPLLLVLARPLFGWALSAAGAALVATLPLVDRDPWPWPVPHGLVLLTLLFAVAVRESLPRAVLAWFATAVLFELTLPGDSAAGWVFAVTAVAVIGVLVGRLARSNRRLAQQAAQREREQAHRVVLEERARIARDLHDVVAHHMSLVVVQAETAPYRIPDLSESVRAEFGAISEGARAALAETRTLLGVLRRDGDALEHAPQPALEQLGELVAAARRAGVQVDADIDARPAGLRPGTSLAAYRIAQEALANAARHAPGAPVRLRLRQAGDAVHLEVTNPASGPSNPPGHGITGMRERVRAEGGELTAAPTPDGRFAVEARLPTGPPP